MAENSVKCVPPDGFFGIQILAGGAYDVLPDFGVSLDAFGSRLGAFGKDRAHTSFCRNGPLQQAFEVAKVSTSTLVKVRLLINPAMTPEAV